MAFLAPPLVEAFLDGRRKAAQRDGGIVDWQFAAQLAAAARIGVKYCRGHCDAWSRLPTLPSEHPEKVLRIGPLRADSRSGLFACSIGRDRKRAYVSPLCGELLHGEDHGWVAGWGTWIRTKTNRVRADCSTVKLSPKEHDSGRQVDLATAGPLGKRARLGAFRGLPSVQGKS